MWLEARGGGQPGGKGSPGRCRPAHPDSQPSPGAVAGRPPGPLPRLKAVSPSAQETQDAQASAGAVGL